LYYAGEELADAMQPQASMVRARAPPLRADLAWPL